MSEVMNILGDECRGDECRTIIQHLHSICTLFWTRITLTLDDDTAFAQHLHIVLDPQYTDLR